MSRYLAWIDTPLNNQIEMIEHLKYAGVVVPVEPDATPWLDMTRQEIWELRQWCDQRLAALGVGEETP